MYIYGKNVVKDAKNVEEIYLAKNFKDSYLIDGIKAPVKYLEREKLDEMVDGNHQGIVLKVRDFNYKNIKELNGDIIVMLDHIEDPHNLGAIIRTCEAAGIYDVIIPKDRAAMVNGTVMKTSAGTVSNFNIARVTNLPSTLRDLKKEGYWVIGTDMEGTDYKEIDYKGKIVIVVGNEGSGMSRLVKENCDFIASINMRGKVNSLNASVAAGLILFEAIR